MEVSFNDTRCGGGRGVCLTDPLLFTCTVTGVISDDITVNFTAGHEIHINSYNTEVVDLPHGVTVHNQNVEITDYYTLTKNKSVRVYEYMLTLSIVNASLLNGSIICSVNGSNDEAECPVVGKLVIWSRYGRVNAC